MLEGASMVGDRPGRRLLAGGRQRMRHHDTGRGTNPRVDAAWRGPVGKGMGQRRRQDCHQDGKQGSPGGGDESFAVQAHVEIVASRIRPHARITGKHQALAEPHLLGAIRSIHGDPKTNTFNPAGPLTTIGQARIRLQEWRDQWREQGIGPWAIATRAAPGQVIGGISLHNYLGLERVNLGYRFDTAAWGAGYATELGRAALAVGFDECRFTEIYALVRPAHRASIRVLEKIGMVRVDTLDDVPGAAPSLVYKAVRTHAAP